MKRLALLCAVSVLIPALTYAEQVSVLAEGGAHDAYFALDFSGQTGLAVGLDGETLKTLDSGRSWVRSDVIGDGSAILGISLSEHGGIAVGQSGKLWVQSAEGWTPVETGQTERWLNVDLSESGLAVVVGGFGALAVSTDNGRSWVRPEIDWETLLDDWVEPHLFDVSISGQLITIVGEFGLILQSEDRGATWQVRSKREESLFALTMQSDGTGFVAGQKGLVLQTTNHGLTWTKCGISGDGNFYGAASRGRSVAVVGMRTAWVSQNGCKSFQPVSDAETESGWLQSVKTSQQENSFFAVGDRGRVLKISTGN